MLDIEEAAARTLTSEALCLLHPRRAENHEGDIRAQKPTFCILSLVSFCDPIGELVSHAEWHERRRKVSAHNSGIQGLVRCAEASGTLSAEVSPEHALGHQRRGTL